MKYYNKEKKSEDDFKFHVRYVLTAME